MYPDISRNRVFILLWLMAIHSFFFALGLIFLPTKFLPFFGFLGYSGRFFQMQSGVFHIVMSVAYLLGAYQMDRSPGLIIFSIYAKTIATVFLVCVFIFSETSWMILLSAFGDGMMALLLFFFYRLFANQTNITNND